MRGQTPPYAEREKSVYIEQNIISICGKGISQDSKPAQTKKAMQVASTSFNNVFFCYLLFFSTYYISLFWLLR